MQLEIDGLLARVGRYGGHGINHEEEPFHGELVLQPLPGDRGVSLEFRAVGIDGTTYHHECAWIAPNAQGETVLYAIHANGGGVMQYERRHGTPPEGCDQTVVFGVGQPAEADELRLEVAIDLWPDGDLSYRHAWGLPGGDYKPRSDVRMSVERGEE
ncbi:MAG: hypothetical protein KTR31_06500 [Myxococcales bacterium]|nr:hypothetical protein [Myxococcales bacterium]